MRMIIFFYLPNLMSSNLILKWIGYFLNKDKNQFLMGDSSYAEDIHDSYEFK